MQAMQWIKRAVDSEFERQVAAVNHRLESMRADAKQREELGMPPFKQSEAEDVISSNEHAAWAHVTGLLDGTQAAA